MADAYKQIKVAITEPQFIDKPIPRKPQPASTIINNEIMTKGYVSKGLVAVNASGMVSSRFNTSAPESWFGTAAIPVIINDGIVIRDSTSEHIKVKMKYIYGIKKDGNLEYYAYQDGDTEEEIMANETLPNKIIADGVKYTFGFTPVLLYNGELQSVTTKPDIRQGLCQIDKNNFIIITNTVASTSQSDRNKGLSLKSLAEHMVNYGCRTGFNLDGGGSTSYFYKKSETSALNKYPTAYDGRDLSDILYFVEQ